MSSIKMYELQYKPLNNDSTEKFILGTSVGGSMQPYLYNNFVDESSDINMAAKNISLQAFNQMTIGSSGLGSRIEIDANKVATETDTFQLRHNLADNRFGLSYSLNEFNVTAGLNWEAYGDINFTDYDGYGGFGWIADSHRSFFYIDAPATTITTNSLAIAAPEDGISTIVTIDGPGEYNPYFGIMTQAHMTQLYVGASNITPALRIADTYETEITIGASKGIGAVFKISGGKAYINVNAATPGSKESWKEIATK